MATIDSASKARKALARRHRKVANRGKNKTHQTTAKLIARHCLIITEGLAIKNMTASAKGTVDKPGKNVAQKAGLNRAIPGHRSPGSLINNLLVKSEEAGRCRGLVLNTCKHTPSQKCPGCKAIVSGAGQIGAACTHEERSQLTKGGP